MVSILFCLWLSIVLLYWTFTITGSKPENTSDWTILGRGMLLSLGVTCALLFTTQLAAKMFWLVMIQEFDPTWLILLLEAIKNSNSGHTAISTGITL